MTPTANRPASLRCRLLRVHRYVVRSTEDGGRYRTCTRCGRDWYGGSSAIAGGYGAGGFAG